MKIKYSNIERVFGNHLILYKGRVYVTKENAKVKSRLITLIDKGLSEDDFAELQQEQTMLLMRH
jgi:hypothetical protein